MTKRELREIVRESVSEMLSEQLDKAAQSVYSKAMSFLGRNSSEVSLGLQESLLKLLKKHHADLPKKLQEILDKE